MQGDFHNDSGRGETNGERLRRELRLRLGLGDYGQRANMARTAIAVCLILFGGVLFLSNLGLFPTSAVWNFWPLLIIAFGAIQGLRRPSVTGLVWAAFLILAGVVVFLFNLGVIQIRPQDDSWPLSLLVIAFGVLMLVRALEGKSQKRSLREGLAAAFRPAPISALRDWAIFGSVKRRIETPDFNGGEATSIFGNVELDLRRALISNPERTVTVDMTAIFGGVKMRVPETWRLSVQGVGILGAFEDKTITANMAGFDAPVLVVTGLSIFGAVEIEN